MDLSRAMALVDVWRKSMPKEPDKQSPMYQALLAMHKELRADRLLELHARLKAAEDETERLRADLDKVRNALTNSLTVPRVV